MFVSVRDKYSIYFITLKKPFEKWVFLFEVWNGETFGIVN